MNEFTSKDALALDETAVDHKAKDWSCKYMSTGTCTPRSNGKYVTLQSTGALIRRCEEHQKRYSAKRLSGIRALRRLEDRKNKNRRK